MKREIKFKQTEIGMIPEEWEVGNFHNDLVVKGRIGWRGYTISDLKKEGPIVLGGENIKSFFYIDYSNVKHLSKEKYDESPEIQLKPNDVLLVTRGNLGEVAHFKGEFKEVTINPSIVILSNFKGDSKFLYYFLISPTGKTSINSIKSGSSVPAIYQSEVKKIRYPKPPLPEQRAIAKILSDLDVKVELNQQMNKTLEEIGQAIFKHWFIDFEFTNEEGEPYKSSGGEMVYNEELGKEIPKVWEVSNIGKELKTILGGTPSRERKEYWINGNIPWINSGEINKFPIIDATEYITPDALKNSATQLMPKRTVVLPFVISINKQISISILGTEVCGNQSVLGIVEKQGLPSEYIYYWVEHMKKDIYSWATGGAQQHINKTNVDKTKILIPSKDVMQNYSRIVRQIFDLVIKNSLEVKTLSQIRDVLLPKLMSGKIRVPLEEENG